MSTQVQRYFKIDSDVYVKSRWYIVDPKDQNGADVSALFKQASPVKMDAPVKLGHSDAAPRGNPLDYTRITGDRVPVASARVAEILKRLAPEDLELIPAEVEGFLAEVALRPRRIACSPVPPLSPRGEMPPEGERAKRWAASTYWTPWLCSDMTSECHPI